MSNIRIIEGHLNAVIAELINNFGEEEVYSTLLGTAVGMMCQYAGMEPAKNIIMSMVANIDERKRKLLN